MRILFLYLARTEGFKNFALKFRFFRNAASRFIAGETVEDAMQTVREANRRGLKCTLDLLGENTHSREDALRACEELIDLQKRILRERAGCNLSVKLTQLGIIQDPQLCEQNLARIARDARIADHFVRVDMEDSSHTDATLDIVEQMHANFGNVGTVIQAYLYRSEQDLIRMMDRGIRIRLVKGAYREPASIAYGRKKDTDANYIKLMRLLLKKGDLPAIATHDPHIIRAAKRFAEDERIPNDSFEFQMLYGIRRDLQSQLIREGYSVRIYVPYGSHWYAYFMRRLAERPANVMFLVRNLFIEKKWNKETGMGC